jgi:hypothetical protein
MTKMFVVTRKILVILIMIALMAPMALASEYIDTFCFDAHTTKFDGRFELATSLIVDGNYQLNGTLTEQITKEKTAVDGNGLIDGDVLKMTLRSSEVNAAGMSITTYHIELSAGDSFSNGTLKSISQSYDGSFNNPAYDIGGASMVPCTSENTDLLDVDNDGDGFTEKQGDCNDSDRLQYPDAYEACEVNTSDCNYTNDPRCPLDEDNDNDGYSYNEGDCNDSESTWYPGAYDTCGDGFDQDCNGEDASCSTRFTDNQNGTLSDAGSGLVWQKADDGHKRSWTSAQNYCSFLSDNKMGGSQTWRLPSKAELNNIVDISLSPTIDPTFTGTIKGAYWTITDGQNPLKAWFVNFYNGEDSVTEKTNASVFVRCVHN